MNSSGKIHDSSENISNLELKGVTFQYSLKNFDLMVNCSTYQEWLATGYILN